MTRLLSKKIILILLVSAMSLSLAGCWRKKVETAVTQEIAETGQTYDVSDKTGQAITVEPGDVLYLKLAGEAKSGLQWQVASPTSGNFLVLKDHQAVGLDDPNALDGKFTDEWWLKVQETGEVNLRFNYVVPGKPDEPKNSFELKVISQ